MSLVSQKLGGGGLEPNLQFVVAMDTSESRWRTSRASQKFGVYLDTLNSNQDECRCRGTRRR